MSPRRAHRLARGLTVLVAAMLIASHGVAIATGTFEPRISDLFSSAIGVTFAAVGALVAARHPSNAIGWIFLGVALSLGVSGLGRDIVEIHLQHGGRAAAPAGVAAAYSEVSWMPFVLVPATFLLLLFPDGRLPSRRWRFVAWCAGLGIVGFLLTGITTSGPLGDFPTVGNPLAVDSPMMDLLGGLSSLLLAVGMLGSAISIVLRFRRAGRLQRQQIKWLATAGAIVAVTFPVMLVLYDVLGPHVADSVIMLTVLGLPAAAGIAILRHRLYDIDVVINRTLVYGALTATLAAVYLGSVLLLQLILSGVTADSNLAVAGSTLAVAALFQPGRRRIQTTVDRRFYRRRYDAARTVEAFGAHLRDQVDIDALALELRAVVGETMQPQHVSLWLRTS